MALRSRINCIVKMRSKSFRQITLIDNIIILSHVYHLPDQEVLLLHTRVVARESLVYGGICGILFIDNFIENCLNFTKFYVILQYLTL